MGDSGSDFRALRIERGRATDEELAAVTVVLLSALAARSDDDEDAAASGSPLWRPEPAPAAYRSPYSWQ